MLLMTQNQHINGKNFILY